MQSMRYILFSTLLLAQLGFGLNQLNAGGPRSALILSNFNYKDFEFTSALPSLDIVQAGLEKEGFLVTRLENILYKGYQKTLEAYARSVPTNGTVLVYCVGFAAHTERFGKWYNLLHPANEDVKNDSDYRSRGLNLTQLIEILDQNAASRHNLYFFDASWESPIIPVSDKLRPGLRVFEPANPRTTTVVFSALAEKVHPLPEKGKPSEFAKSLAANIKKFEESTTEGCKSLGDVWFSTPENASLGKLSKFPTTVSLRVGNVAGEGFTNASGMSFLWCPPGKFTMGTDDSDNSFTRDRQPVEVTLSRGFWIGQYEVTQREYSTVMRKNPPRGFTEGLNVPWFGIGETKQVMDFCKKLTEIEKQAKMLPDGWTYSLMTEAQWEYACRAGSQASYCFGDDVTQLGQYANFADNALHKSNPDYYWAEKRTDDGVAEALAPVGSYLPNAWGIYDMHGNVAEIVYDHYLEKLPGGVDPFVRMEKNGTGQTRGGAWCSLPLYCQSTFRNTHDARSKANYVGFRIAIIQESK